MHTTTIGTGREGRDHGYPTMPTEAHITVTGPNRTKEEQNQLRIGKNHK